MGTFYLGLSMAGTVSAGTYTGGVLSEINNWLSQWQTARSNGITLKAQYDTKQYKKGDTIQFTKQEIPNHRVKIKSLTGASGGGVSAALFLAGLSSGNSEAILREVWTKIDIKDMFNNDDLTSNKSIYSILNVKPIDDLKEMLLNQKWGEIDYAKKLDYLDDNIEVFLTLASYEGIPYKVSPTAGTTGSSYGIHKSHLDYIKFNFSKNGKPAPVKKGLPYAYNLIFNKNHFFKDDNNWNQLFQSAPATAAFPFGFKPRSLKRYLKEYEGKLFYMDYTNPSNSIKYATLTPAWSTKNPITEPFEMEYIDGGTFNNEPHDLARASIIESLKLPDGHMPCDGITTSAAVILIDPFPSDFDPDIAPGEAVKGIPTIFEQPKYFLGAILDQGRFRPDWIEKTLNEKYYSRFLVSPVRKDANNIPQDVPLAASLLGAFSGFIDISYREHDYKLGLYNTYQFLKEYFTILTKNKEVDYYAKANTALKEKYEAVGWYNPKTKECQIIPRMVEPNLNNSLQHPVWPSIAKDQWEEVCDLALQRAKALADAVTNFGWVAENTVDPAIWNFLLKGKVKNLLDGIENDLIKHGLLRK